MFPIMKMSKVGSSGATKQHHIVEWKTFKWDPAFARMGSKIIVLIESFIALIFNS